MNSQEFKAVFDDSMLLTKSQAESVIKMAQCCYLKRQTVDWALMAVFARRWPGILPPAMFYTMELAIPEWMEVAA